MKAIKLTAILLLASLGAIAQDSKFELGIVGGPTLSTLRNAPGESTQLSIFFAAGLSLEYHFNSWLSLATNPAFERKGFNYQVQDYSYNNSLALGTYYIHHDFVVLPVLIKAYTSGDKVRFFANIGPYIDFLISGTLSEISSNGNVVYTQTDNAARQDLGVTAGGGICIPIQQKFRISIELRDNYELLSSVNTNNSHYNSVNLLFGINYKL